jgi:hypothetical protein
MFQTLQKQWEMKRRNGLVVERCGLREILLLLLLLLYVSSPEHGDNTFLGNVC